MSEVMLDIETYSTKNNAAILTLGAVKFNRNSGVIGLDEMDTFYRRIDLESNKTYGRDINEDTLLWWSTQPEEARVEMESDENRIPLKQALQEFNKWFKGSEYIWSHGDDFDTVIVNSAMQDCGLETPWKFWNTRDTRTLYDLAGVRNYHLPQNSKHHALHDCHNQITGVLLALRKLKL